MVAAEMPRLLAARRGFAVDSGPPGYPVRIRRRAGGSLYFVANRFDLNPHRAVVVARDKLLLAYHLLHMGYPVPAGRIFNRRGLTAAEDYALDLGLPVVVKPRAGTNGRLVTVAHDQLEVSRALRAIVGRRRGASALVQEKVEGLDHRLVSVDGEILAAYLRRPIAVCGDGIRSIDELLDDVLRSLHSRGRRVELEAGDARIDARLRAHDVTRQSVLPAGVTIALLDTANLSTGGEAEDVSDRIHPAYRELARRLARDSGLRFCGIDLITAVPLDQPPRGYWILELNAAPRLDHFWAMGAAPQRRVEAIFERIFDAMERL